MFRTFLILGALATALFGYAQYLGKPAFGSANEVREKAGTGGVGRLYHK
ncbi:hypothetical protein [Chitinimonas sp. BJYL2]|nr:hypothetical protein [Chitinimonas sp. BJYL2]